MINHIFYLKSFPNHLLQLQNNLSMINKIIYNKKELDNFIYRSKFNNINIIIYERKHYD